MKVFKWGKSLAIRLPAAVVDALDLKEGDHIDIKIADIPSLEIVKIPTPRELLARLRKFRGSMPLDFKFDRWEANQSG